MADVDTLPKATVLFEEYEILRVLGTGGFGITYLAQHLSDETLVAVKEYYPRGWCKRDRLGAVSPTSSSRQEQFDWGLRRFLEEAQRLARFDHPNIVRAERYFSVNGTAYMVLSYEDGQTLADWLQRRNVRPDQAELDVIVAPLLSALEELHTAGVFHRDLSPDNIVIRKDGSPVLLDFGASREQISRRSQLMTAIIKPGYSPIEQYDNKAARQGPWTDIYALGAVLYRVVANEHPPESPARFAHDDYVPLSQVVEPGVYRPTFLDAIDWSLRLLPDDRPQSVADWRQCLLGDGARPAMAQMGETGATRRPTFTALTRMRRIGEFHLGRISQLASARHGLMAIGVAGVLALSVAVAYLTSSGPGESEPPQRTALALKAYTALQLSRDDRLMVARGLYHTGFSRDPELDMTFINAGQVGGALRDAIIGFQKSRAAEETGYPTAEQVAYLKDKGSVQTPWEVETAITVVQEHPDAVWLRIAATLRESGDLNAEAPERIDLRAALKRYQARNGIAPSGYLNEKLLLALLDTPIRLKVTEGGGDERFSDWYFSNHNGNCRVWTNVSRLKGRSLLLDAPRVEITRRAQAAGDDLGFDLVQTARLDQLFETRAGVHFLGGGSRYQLQFDDGRIKPRKLSQNTFSEEVIKKLYSYAGDAEVKGLAKLGGPMAVVFSTAGFAQAFDRMAEACGPQIMSLVQNDWAAVYRNARGKFHSVSRQLSRGSAMTRARKKCEQASPNLSCSWVAAFRAPTCFSAARPATGGEPAHATGQSIAAARELAVQRCRQLFGPKTACRVTETLCSDGRTD